MIVVLLLLMTGRIRLLLPMSIWALDFDVIIVVWLNLKSRINILDETTSRILVFNQDDKEHKWNEVYPTIHAMQLYIVRSMWPSERLAYSRIRGRYLQATGFSPAPFSIHNSCDASTLFLIFFSYTNVRKTRKNASREKGVRVYWR